MGSVLFSLFFKVHGMMCSKGLSHGEILTSRFSDVDKSVKSITLCPS